MTSQASRFRTRICARQLGARASRPSRKQGGIALITTLLLLVLLSLLGLTMAVTANSDMLINSYYGSYRSSFYAADSGLNIARAAMINTIKGAATMTPCLGWGPTGASGCTEALATGPLNGATAATLAQNYISGTTSAYKAFGSLNAGQAANSWPANFMIPTSITGCTTSVSFPTGAGVTNPQVLTTVGSLVTSYQYTFNYTLCAVGRAQASQQVATKESGNLIVTITAQGPTSGSKNTSFAAFGKFTINFAECQGGLVTGTITGPLWTNGSWNFGTGGSGYTFTDPVNQVDPNASFVFGGGGHGAPSCNGVSGCDCKNASSDTYNGTTIAPTFQAGFNRNQPAATIPSNDYVQQWAIIDGVGCGEGGSTCGVTPPPYPTNAQLHTFLKDISGTAYPSGGATSGVFMAYCTSDCATYPAPSPTANTILGGGFYVEGDASIQLSLGTDGSGNPTQIYTITQTSTGSCGHRYSGSCSHSNTTTTITLDSFANGGVGSTKVVSGTTLNLAGVPMNRAIATPMEGAMLYVDGTITGLSGPTGQSNENTASIQDYYGTTVSANGDIDVTGNLKYKTEPVTLNSSDTLVANADHNQVLGLFTANGNVVISSPYTDNNLETDAVVAPIASPCPGGSSSCGFATGSGGVSTWTIVGGQIQANVHSVSISTRNTWFDRRFTSRTDGFAPPWFPSTYVPASATSDTPSAPSVQPTTQRLTWVTWPQ